MSNKAVCRPKDKRKDEILRGYEYYLRDAEKNELDLLRRETKATKTTSVITDMPRGSDGLDAGDHIADWEPLLKNIRMEIEKSAKERIKILGYLDMVKNWKLRTVLQYTYIHCMSTKEVAEEMNYSTRQIQRLLDMALEHIDI